LEARKASSEQIHNYSVNQDLDIDGIEWLTIIADTLPLFKVKVSDFEDDQVLLEILQQDSSGQYQRLEGCELLMIGDSTNNFSGATLGEFCGLRGDSDEYINLKLQVDSSYISLQIETRDLEDPTILQDKQYLLKRLD